MEASHLTTGWMEWMSHRKRKETKQQPGTARPGNILGCCLVSLRFLFDIHSIHSEQVYLTEENLWLWTCSGAVWWTFNEWVGRKRRDKKERKKEQRLWHRVWNERNVPWSLDGIGMSSYIHMWLMSVKKSVNYSSAVQLRGFVNDIWFHRLWPRKSAIKLWYRV